MCRIYITTDHVHQFDRSIDAFGKPGGMIADAGGVNGGIDDSDNFLHSASVTHQAFKCAWFIVNAQFADNGFACLVQPDDFNFSTFATKFEYCHV